MCPFVPRSRPSLRSFSCLRLALLYPLASLTFSSRDSRKNSLRDFSLLAAITLAFFKRDVGRDKVTFCLFIGMLLMLSRKCVYHILMCKVNRRILLWGPRRIWASGALQLRSVPRDLRREAKGETWRPKRPSEIAKSISRNKHSAARISPAQSTKGRQRIP